jgi:DNA-binding response OmpR family regulator
MGAQASILLCDDDVLLLDLLEHRLSQRGFAISRAETGTDAFDQISRARPDAVVLDAMMPGLDGFEVLRRMRADEALRGIPVLMLTARKQQQDIVGALELGANDFMVKPFMPEELVARLTRLLGAGARA